MLTVNLLDRSFAVTKQPRNLGKRHSIHIDNIQYGLRLTADVFTKFRTYLEDALREQKLDDVERRTLQRVLDWHETLVPHPTLPTAQAFVQGGQFAPPPEGFRQMFAVGSLIDFERDGVRSSRQVAGYKVLTNQATQEKTLAYQLHAPFNPVAKHRPMAAFDNAGRLVTDRVKPEDEKPEVLITVNSDQVQAPLTHIRFNYSWVNLETLETMPPQVAVPDPSVVGVGLPANDKV